MSTQNAIINQHNISSDNPYGKDSKSNRIQVECNVCHGMYTHETDDVESFDYGNWKDLQSDVSDRALDLIVTASTMFKIHPDKVAGCTSDKNIGTIAKVNTDWLFKCPHCEHDLTYVVLKSLS